MWWIPNPIGIITAPFQWGLEQLKSAGGDLIKEAFQWLSGLLLSGVAWLFVTVWNFISEATTPNMYATWFTGGPYAVMRSIAGAVLMLAVMLAVAEAIWNRSGAGLLRSVAQDFPKALFLLTSLLFITTVGLGFADAVSAWLMGMFSGSANDFATAMSNVAGDLQFGAGLIVVILAALLMLLVLLVLAVGFVFREGFIFFLVAITVVMVAVDVYRPTKGAAGQAFKLLAGAIIAKPVVALCFALGGAMLGQVTAETAATGEVAEPGTAATTTEVASPGDPVVAEVAGADAEDLSATIGTLLAGMATMVLAVAAPAVMLRLIPTGGASTVADGQQEVTAKAASAAKKAAALL